LDLEGKSGLLAAFSTAFLIEPKVPWRENAQSVRKVTDFVDRHYFPSQEADVLPWARNFMLVQILPLPLTLREEDRGRTVYMAGRWKEGRGQEGPWSAIISAIIP
jgi:hypothetical protein